MGSEVDLQLVFPGQNKGFRSSPSSWRALPLAVYYLAAYVRDRLPHLRVEVLNAEVISPDEVSSRIDARLVGISCQFLNYALASEIAAVAKSRGATVLLGGPYPSVRPKQILQNNPSVDFVAIGEGEDPLVALLAGQSQSSLDGVAYRDGQQIAVNTPTRPPNVHGLPFPDFGSDLIHYFERQKTFFGRATYPLITSRGCHIRVSDHRCFFCAVPTFQPRPRSPEDIWGEVQQAWTRVPFDEVWDLANSICVSPAWLKSLSASRPRELGNLQIRAYCSPEEITTSTAACLSRLNVSRLFVGLESGSRDSLRNLNRRNTLEDNQQCLKILSKDTGIEIEASFVLGAPGENRTTLRETQELIKRARHSKCVRGLRCSILTPTPGSPAFAALLRTAEGRKYANVDVFDVESLRKDYVKSFCQVGYEELLEFLKRIAEAFPEVQSKYSADSTAE